MMANVDISVIIPCKDSKKKTAEIIRKISENTAGIETEFIVIDMNSKDNSVLSALNEIKKRNLKGYVIQSGGGTVSSALNTGIITPLKKKMPILYFQLPKQSLSVQKWTISKVLNWQSVL